MNKRIQQLIEAATVSEKGPPNWEMTDNTVIRRLDSELLVRLVIKECASVYRNVVKVNSTLYPTEFSTALYKYFEAQDDVPNA